MAIVLIEVDIILFYKGLEVDVGDVEDIESIGSDCQAAVRDFRGASIALQAMRTVSGMIDILGVWFSMAIFRGKLRAVEFVGFMVWSSIGEMTEN